MALKTFFINVFYLSTLILWYYFILIHLVISIYLKHINKYLLINYIGNSSNLNSTSNSFFNYSFNFEDFFNKCILINHVSNYFTSNLIFNFFSKYFSGFENFFSKCTLFNYSGNYSILNTIFYFFWKFFWL